MRSRSSSFLFILLVFLAAVAWDLAAPRQTVANSGCSLVQDASPEFDGFDPMCMYAPGNSCYQCIYSSPETSGYQFCAETPDAGVRLCSYAPDIQQVPF